MGEQVALAAVVPKQNPPPPAAGTPAHPVDQWVCRVLAYAETLLDHLNSSDWADQGMNEAGLKAIVLAATWATPLPPGFDGPKHDISEETIDDNSSYIDLRVSFANRIDNCRVNVLFELKYVRVAYVTELGGDNKYDVYNDKRRTSRNPKISREFHQQAAEDIKLLSRDGKMKTKFRHQYWEKGAQVVEFHTVQKKFEETETQLSGYDKNYRPFLKGEQVYSYIVVGLGPCILARSLERDKGGKYTAARLYGKEEGGGPKVNVPPTPKSAP